MKIIQLVCADPETPLTENDYRFVVSINSSDLNSLLNAKIQVAELQYSEMRIDV